MNYSHISTLCVLLLLILASCAGDDSIPIDDDPVTDCTELFLSKSSASSFDTIYVQNLPEDYAAGTTVNFGIEMETELASMALEQSINDRYFFIAPLHPKTPLEGGIMTVTISNSNSQIDCAARSLTINPLPAADGRTEEVLNVLRSLLDQRLDVLQINISDIQGDLDNIKEEYFPLAFYYNSLFNTDSDQSLINLINNDILLQSGDLEKETSVQISDRILNHFNILELIQSDIASFQERIPFSNQGTQIKSSCAGLNPEEIARQMRIAADASTYLDSNSERGKRMQETSDGVLLTGIIPGLGTAAALTGISIFSYKKFYEGVYNTYISDFTSFTYDINPLEYLEETACSPVPYENPRVWVTNKGWNLDKSIWESLIQLAGLAASKIPWSSKFQSVPFDASAAFTSKQLDNIGSQGYFDGDKFKVDANMCGPIPVDDTKYIYATLVGDAFTLNENEFNVEPQRDGISDLKVGLRSQFFAGNTESKTVQLKIKPVQVAWEPSRIYRVTPGEEFEAKVKLFNAFQKDVKITEEQGAAVYQGFEDTGVPFEGVQKYKIITPSDESLYPYTIIAEHESDKCLRGKNGAEPRFSILTIEAGITVNIISLETGCLRPGQSRDFDAIVTGNNPDVQWNAYNDQGNQVSITDAGLFTAPQDLGGYLIVATSIADPTVSDSIIVDVSNCECIWDLVIDGTSLSGDDVNFNRVTLPQTVLMLFTDENNLDLNFTLQFSKKHLPADGATRQVSLSQTDGEEDAWLYSGVINSISYVAPAPEDSDGNPEPGPANLSLEMTLNGTELSGTISGTIVKSEVVGGNISQSLISITHDFRANELDPGSGLWGCD